MPVGATSIADPPPRRGSVSGFFSKIFPSRDHQAALPAPATIDTVEVAKPKPRGGAGNSIQGGLLEDIDQTSAVRGVKWYGEPGRIGIAQKMVRDPHVRKSLDAITGPIQAAIWDVRPASKSPLDVEIADFVRWVLLECNDWSSALRLSLLYLRDGFSILEATDDVRIVPTERFPNHPGNGSGIVFTGFHHRPAPTVRKWIQSSVNPTQISGIEQYIPGSDGEEPGSRVITADRLIRFTQDQEGANFAGLAQLRSAYGAWMIKIMLMQLDGIRHERESNGVPMLTLPAGAQDEEIDKAEIMVSQLHGREKGYLILPDGWSFEFKTTDGGSTNIGEAIERCNRDIAFNVGAGFMLLGLSGSTGSYALAQTQQGQYEIGLETHARFIANVWNLGADGWSPIERLVRLNYGPDFPLPRLVARNMPTRDWSKVLPIVSQLGATKFLTPDDVTEAFVRESLFMPQHDPETSRVAAPDTADADLQSTALNGAQVTALLEVIDKVVSERLPRESAVNIITSAFNVDEAGADKMLGEVGHGFVPRPVQAPVEADAAQTEAQP